MSQRYARGMRIVPLMEDGRPYYDLDGSTIKINMPGVYSIGYGTPSEFSAGHEVEVSDEGATDGSIPGRVLTELCRELAAGGHWPIRRQEQLVQAVAERMRDILPNGILTIPGKTNGSPDHLHVITDLASEADDEPSVEVQAAAHQGLALSWLQQGTLDLPALAAAIGMDVDQGVLRVRPTEQAKITGPHGSWDTRTVEIPSHTRTQVVGPDGDLPAVWVQQYSGRNVRIKVDRSHGLRGAVNTEVWVYHGSDADGPQDAVSLGSANRVLREATQAQAKIIQEHIDRANELRDRLARVGRYLHVQANRLHVTAQGMTAEAQADGNEFYVMCDVLAKLRETAADVCGVPYDETEKLDPNEGVPWSLRQWALLARQTLEQQALHLADALKYIQESTGWLSSSIGVRVPAHAVDLMRQVVAEYPEDLDVVQAEQATRNADDEAVRRLAHAMTEVANSIENVSMSPDAALAVEGSVRKLRDTVATWTTEEQRRPWAAAMSGHVVGGATLTFTRAGEVDPALFDLIAGARVDPDVHGSDNHRCRCGKLDGQASPGCEWHGSPVKTSQQHCATRDGCKVGPDTDEDEAAAPDFPGLNLENVGAMRGPIQFKIQREVPAEVVEKLARTMQSVASGIEAAYRPGGPPWGIGQAIEALRSESAPWTSDALRAHEGEPADPEDTSADLKNTEALQGPHGAGGSERVPSQVIVALRDAKALLETMRGQETPSLILWARAARIRLAEALKLVES